MKISPQSMRDFRMVRGFGKMKIDAYGQDIIEIFQSEEREDTLDLEDFYMIMIIVYHPLKKRSLTKPIKGESIYDRPRRCG